MTHKATITAALLVGALYLLVLHFAPSTFDVVIIGFCAALAAGGGYLLGSSMVKWLRHRRSQ